MVRYLRFLLFVLLIVSCVKEETWENDVLNEAVDVCVRLEVTGEGGDTKAVVDPQVENADLRDIIKNLWVLQYDGTGDDARLIGEPQYFSNMDIFLSPVAENGFGSRVKLVRSSGMNRIVFMANTFNPLMSFPKDSDLGDLKKRWTIVEDTESFLASSGSDKYLMFNGSVEVSVTDEATISCRLKRNVAKVSIRLINSSSNVTINSWQIRNIPSISYYFTDYDLPAGFPSVSDFSAVDYPTCVPESPLLPQGQAASAPYEEYTIYLPVNRRGVDNRVTSEKQKNYFAPASATYLQVNASYDNGLPIQYTFYLGENLTTDFNILPNHLYTYDFNITAPGDADTDTRVKELGLVDFTQTELANCYILNPAQTEGVRRKFMIPVARVDEFWGGNGYENNPNYTLGTSKNWTVRIITTNFVNDGKLEITKASGTGKNDHFEVTVAPNTVGNAIVALYAGGEQACWSWHLWITNYSPDEAYSKVPQDGVYSYSVTSGVVHRYKGGLWGNEYAKRFIMDRNLGAWDAGKLDGKYHGAMYYQYGRKDPFFHSGSEGYENYDTRSSADIEGANSDPAAPVMIAVNNPLTFISSDSWGAWTTGNKYNPASMDNTILWMDPYTSSKYTSSPREKSLFDPCPPGYCVPKSGTWSDFKLNTETSPTTNINGGASPDRGFKPFDQGFMYWPYPEGGATDVLPDHPVYYPAAGVRQPNSTPTWYGLGNNIYMSTASMSSAIQVYTLHATTASVRAARTDMGKNHGITVRCVTSRDVN